MISSDVWTRKILTRSAQLIEFGVYICSLKKNEIKLDTKALKIASISRKELHSRADLMPKWFAQNAFLFLIFTNEIKKSEAI